MLHSNIYRMTKPCDDCPFVDRTKLHISEDRVNQIKEELDKGESFNCHKTAYPDEFGVEPIGLKMCYGAWKYLKDTNNPNAVMKFAEHVGVKDG